MTDPKDLLAQIYASPEDDAPRLVYADYLIDRGDPRGELIQIQCALAGDRLARMRSLGRSSTWFEITDPPEGPAVWQRERALQDRVQALLREHGEEWNAAFKAHGASAHFERGFPHILIAQPQAFLAAKHLIAREPIRAVTLVADVKPWIREIAAAPELDRITTLKLGSSPRYSVTEQWAIGDAGLAALAAAPLASLRSFELEYSAIGPDGARALAAARWLPRLTKLRLPENPIGTAGVVALAQPPRLANLSVLDLHDTAIEDAAAIALAAANMTWLESLRLSFTETNPPEFRDCARLGPAAAIALAGTASLGALRWLDLGDNCIADGAVALARSPHFPHLSTLRLGRNQIDDAGAAAFATSAVRAGLVSLDLSHNLIGAAGGAALAASTALASLRELELSDCRLGVAGVTALATGSGLPALSRLGVSRNQLYTGEIDTSGDADYPIEEPSAITRARFAGKPHLQLT